MDAELSDRICIDLCGNPAILISAPLCCNAHKPHFPASPNPSHTVNVYKARLSGITKRHDLESPSSIDTILKQLPCNLLIPRLMALPIHLGHATKHIDNLSDLCDKLG